MICFLMFAGAAVLVMYWFSKVDERTGFLADFAKLLDRPEIRVGFANYILGRGYLVGEFAGRKVRIMLERGGEDDLGFLVVSMEAGVLLRLDDGDFEEHARDRDGERALFALKARHDLRLALRDGCVKARAEQRIFRSFPGRFDPDKWRDVLEQMHALAGSLERGSIERASGVARPA
ncbi:MAG: hypothetical protein ACRD09_09730 [Vicinamibacterales bacterium]